MSRAAFQALHSAARGMFRYTMQTDNHSAETLVYLQLVDAAIDEGHTALGTQRSAADQYIHLVGGLTSAQMQNARKILENEGLLPPE